MKRLPPPPALSSPMRVYVLRCLSEGIASPHRIARKAGKDKSTIKYHLEKLLDAKLVKHDGFTWSISNAGRAALLAESGQQTGQDIPSPLSTASSQRGTPRNSTGSEAGEKTPQLDSAQGWGTERISAGVGGRVRLHKVWLNMGKVSCSKVFEKRVVLNSGAWYSDVQVADGIVRVWSNGRMMAKLPPFWGRTPEDAELEMKQWVVEWAVMVRDALGCPLSDSWTVSQGEVAFVGHPFAKKCEARKLKIKVEDRQGKLWLVVDRSLGEPEMETVNAATHLPDAKLIGDFFNDVRERKWENVILGLAHQNEMLKQLTMSVQVCVQEIQKMGGFRDA